jgi:Tfp pilus assembly protein PilF
LAIAAWALQAVGCITLAGCVGLLDKSASSNGAHMDATPSGVAEIQSNAPLTQATAADPKGEWNARQTSQEAAAAPKRSKQETAREMSDYFQELGKAKQFEQVKKLPEARAVYERLISAYPHRFEAYHHLALVADCQKRHQEAQALYAEAIRLNNRDPGLFNDLGYSFYLHGKLDKAENALLKAVAMRPAEAKYRNNLGLVYGHQGRYDEAWEQFRRAGSEADAYYNLAFVKASQNDFSAAKDSFRRALATDPTHEQARRALRAFELAETQPESLSDLEALADTGTNWIPYVEPGEGPSEGVQPASASARIGPERGAASIHTPTQGMRGSTAHSGRESAGALAHQN